MSDEQPGFDPDDMVLRWRDEPSDDTESVRIVGAEPVGGEPLPPLPSTDATGQLPHWTESPTGESRRLLGDDANEDDLAAWSTFASQPPRWREESADAPSSPAMTPADDLPWSATADDTTVVASRPSLRLDETGADDAPRVTPIRTGRGEAGGGRVLGGGAGGPGPGPSVGPAPRRRPEAANPVAPGGVDRSTMATRIGVGVGFGALALLLFWLGKPYTVALVVAVLTVAAVELFGSLRSAGYQPATLLGLVAVPAAPLLTYWRGEAAFPLMAVLVLAGSFLWFMFVDGDARTMVNLGATVTAVFYLGVLGSFGTLLLKFPNGLGMLIACVLLTVANDVGAYFVGQGSGGAKLAPSISPGKTWIGAVGGAVCSFLVAVVVMGLFGLTPWDKTLHWLELWALVSVIAPLGDLAESKVKRDLQVKDMGTTLPGHGGVLDRFDALLFTLPTTYYLCRALNLF